ncbi:MAG: A/G-specific adenine glycosylase [Firmicutes bacterium]|nr:A/G-specific adenine glycosylase [Bacillota bacterium]
MTQSQFAGQLLGWYETCRRDLPWRRNSDPYRVWVSEAMLQQTRVDTAIPYFERFMARFPSLTALAEASEADVLKAWEGLGYYSRARNLQGAVREVLDRYGGEVPDSLEAMLSLRGVGAYTAGAVLSIAYNRPVPAVDGNVLRVFSRLFLVTSDVGTQKTRRQVEQLVMAVMPEGRAADFNQAIMELGALICVPRAPRCGQCPVRGVCQALSQGMQEQLPVKKAKAGVREQSYAVLLLTRGDDVFIRRRPDRGLLAGLWELPMVAVADARASAADVISEVAQNLALPWSDGGVYRHQFSHIGWTLRVLRSHTTSLPPDLVGDFAPPTERQDKAFGRVFAQILHDKMGDSRTFIKGGGQLELGADRDL